MVISRLGGISGGQAWEIVTGVIVVLPHSHTLHPVSPRELFGPPYPAIMEKKNKRHLETREEKSAQHPLQLGQQGASMQLTGEKRRDSPGAEGSSWMGDGGGPMRSLGME